MSASDKLRNLQGAASKERTQEELFAAFPQLIRVVEAAEKVGDREWAVGTTPAVSIAHEVAAEFASLRAALTALEEALGGDVT